MFFGFKLFCKFLGLCGFFRVWFFLGRESSFFVGVVIIIICMVIDFSLLGDLRFEVLERVVFLKRLL